MRWLERLASLKLTQPGFNRFVQLVESGRVTPAAGKTLLAALVEQPVAGELQQVPVEVTVAGVVLHLADPRAPDGLFRPPRTLLA